MILQSLGWNTFFDEQFDQYRTRNCEPARVSAGHRTYYSVVTAQGECHAVMSGALYYNTHDTSAAPAVGDWVAIRKSPEDDKAVIHGVLERKSSFSRSAAGRIAEEQIVATNIDTLFLAMALNRDFNLRRLERYLTLAWEGGARPVVVLTKTDLCSDPAAYIRRAINTAPGVPVCAVCAATGEGIEQLDEYFTHGTTIAIVGSSGVGKSTLINALVGSDITGTGALRAYRDRGRHTTSARKLIVVEGKGVIIDTPGMRELRLWEGQDGLDQAFADIEQLAVSCRFKNCTHSGEPGCAIATAIDEGRIDDDRYHGYAKLRREIQHQAQKQYNGERRPRIKPEKTPTRKRHSRHTRGDD